MNQRIFLIVSLWVCLFTTSLPVGAQEENTVLNQCQTEYENGRFEEAEQLLVANLNQFKGNDQLAAYRLLALTCLNLDRTDEARRYVEQLLRIDPYYPSYNEGARFADMIETLKDGRQVQVTTASQQAESISEAPVPVTLITEEMIKASGARNLQELLLCYVPGVSPMEGGELNVSMRGTSSDVQSLMLILINGVRINSYTTNSVSLDYRIMLDNIHHIEVLRGPASSLYGDVALTAVVNIITKQGYELNGLQGSVGVGSQHTLTANLMFGKRLVDTDFTVWGSIYRSNGFRRAIPMSDPNFFGLVPNQNAYSIINGYNNPPAYDVGFTFRWKDLFIQFNQQQSKRVHTHTNGISLSYYDYDAFTPVHNAKPGRGVGTTYLTLKWAHTWNNFLMDASVNAQRERTNFYDVMGDSLIEDQYYLYQNLEILKSIAHNGFISQSWNATTLSANVNGLLKYNLEGLGRGNLLVGMQAKRFKVDYFDEVFGSNYKDIVSTKINEDGTSLSEHSEYALSAFLQLKHNFSDKLVFNGGLRYDHQNRFSSRDQKILSPRFSLIYNPKRDLSLRLTYARSFVDASYYWRMSHLSIGNPDMIPQITQQYMFSLIKEWSSLHLRYEGVAFYNKLHNIFTLFDEGTINDGEIANIGLEQVLTYQHGATTVHGNLYLQKVVSDNYAEYLPSKKHDKPAVTASITANQKLGKSCLLHANVYVAGSQEFLGTSFLYRFEEWLVGKVINLPAYALLHLGAQYTLGNFTFVVNCRNVFNTSYRVGGDYMPVYQEGRSVLFKVHFRFE